MNSFIKFYICGLICFSLTAVTANSIGAQEEKKPKDPEPVDVKVNDITLSVPKIWKKTEVTSSMRKGQFTVPAAEGEKVAGELVIFHFGAGGAGGVAANVNRWISQFAEEGRSQKAFQGTSREGRYMLLDVTGTYNKPVGAPRLGKTEVTPGSRMLAVIIDVKDKGPYFLKMTGSEKTIEAAAKDFRKSFGAKSDEEKELKIQ